MYGKVVIKVTEVDDEATAISIHTELDNGSPEEVTDVVHALACSFNLLDIPECAGVLALCMLTNKAAFELAEDMGNTQLMVLAEELHKTVNEGVAELIEARRNRE